MSYKITLTLTKAKTDERPSVPQPVPDATLKTGEPISEDWTLQECQRRFQESAKDVAKVLLQALPGTTVDHLTIKLLHRYRSHLVIAHEPVAEPDKPLEVALLTWLPARDVVPDLEIQINQPLEPVDDLEHQNQILGRQARELVKALADNTPAGFQTALLSELLAGAANRFQREEAPTDE